MDMDMYDFWIDGEGPTEFIGSAERSDSENLANRRISPVLAPTGNLWRAHRVCPRSRFKESSAAIAVLTCRCRFVDTGIVWAAETDLGRESRSTITSESMPFQRLNGLGALGGAAGKRAAGRGGGIWLRFVGLAAGWLPDAGELVSGRDTSLPGTNVCR
jgi:hypothetical protein